VKVHACMWQRRSEAAAHIHTLYIDTHRKTHTHRHTNRQAHTHVHTSQRERAKKAEKAYISNLYYTIPKRCV
jgi:hypothetical protein